MSKEQYSHSFHLQENDERTIEEIGKYLSDYLEEKTYVKVLGSDYEHGQTDTWGVHFRGEGALSESLDGYVFVYQNERVLEITVRCDTSGAVTINREPTTANSVKDELFEIVQEVTNNQLHK